MKMNNVRVFCPICKGGDNIIWEGTFEEWNKELSKKDVLPDWVLPDWTKYAQSHNHQIMVEYPSGLILPFKLYELGKEGFIKLMIEQGCCEESSIYIADIVYEDEGE